MSSLNGGMYGRKKPASSMDILYLLLPIIGGFLLLFLVCCFGKKVKEMLHIPKELVLGRNFPGMTSSSTSSSSSSSQSSIADSDSDQEPTIVINVNMERQRVLSQHRRRYTQIPSDEMVFSQHGDNTDCHTQPSGGPPGTDRPPRCLVMPVVANCRCQVGRKSLTARQRADSCPLLAEYQRDSHSDGGAAAAGCGGAGRNQREMTSYVNIIYGMHPATFFARCHNWPRRLDSDSDSDSDRTSLERPDRPDRKRHRSNSESDLPKRGCQYEEAGYLADQRPSECSHLLASTEFQLHAPQHCSSLLLTASDCDQCSTNQAEVG